MTGQQPATSLYYIYPFEAELRVVYILAYYPVPGLSSLK